MTYIDSVSAAFSADVVGVQTDEDTSPTSVLSADSNNYNNVGCSLRVEAEDMLLEGYRIEEIDFASGSRVVSFFGNEKRESGRASFNFSGKSGIYDVVVGYFDEEGGGATIDPLLNGQSLGRIKLDQKLGSNLAAPNTFVRHLVEDEVRLRIGDTFSLEGFEDANEHARIDYVEFIRIKDLPSQSRDTPRQTVSEIIELEKTELERTDSLADSDPIRINVGGSDYLDSKGQQWIADRYFEDGETYQTVTRIKGTQSDPIYQSGRYAKTMDYHIPVANGIYTVDLHFAEVYQLDPARRTFNIEIEGDEKTNLVNIRREVGINTATSRSFESILVTNGYLDIHLGAQINAAHLSGIEVAAQEIFEPDSEGLQGAIRVNSGGDRYTDTDGNVWLADTFYDDGWTNTRNRRIRSTHDDPLYQSERYARTLDYAIPVENGTYSVNLLFAETRWSDSGERVFDIDVEGRSVADDFDIYREVGKRTAFNQSVQNVVVTDGQLNIALESSQDYAKLSGFEIIPVERTNNVPLGASPLTSGATIRYISPNGRGNGYSWQEAASLSDIDRLIEQSNPGDEIWIAGDLGAYEVGSKSIDIDSGSSASDAIYIRGVASQQGGDDRPVIIGDRAENWSPGKSDGKEIFRLLNGANHLNFSNLHFKNIGNGAFRFGGDVTGVTIQDMEADNVRRFVENTASGRENASVTDLTIKDINVRGFSKGAIRLQYDSNNVLIENVFGDAQGQDGDNFTMGVHLTGSVHNVVHRNVTMKNAIQRKSESEYWNADGFVTEWGTYDITYEDTFASGSTDGGYDLKSQNTTLIRAGASDNKRNFRIWRDADFIDVESDEPFRRGGIGTTAHIHVLGEGSVNIQGGTFTGDRNIENIIFDLDDKGSLTLDGAAITDDNYVLQTVGEGSISLANLKS